MNTPVNPLQRYYRSIKSYITLPSGTHYYPETVLSTVSTTGEVGIMAMTSQDELMFKNPDALLNGEAMISLLNSCVVGLKNPKKLLINDVDAIIVAIRIATYGKDMPIVVDCPACEEKNHFDVDLDGVIGFMSHLDESYTVTLSNGIIVYLKPYYYENSITATLKAFEQSKIMKSLNNDLLPDEEKFKIFSGGFDSIVKFNIDLLANSIIKIEDADNNVIIEANKDNKRYIIDLLNNIDKHDSDVISEKVSEINKVGINKKLDITCQKCKHEWQSTIEYDPVTFFSGS
jgi:hypothetical protein